MFGFSLHRFKSSLGRTSIQEWQFWGTFCYQTLLCTSSSTRAFTWTRHSSYWREQLYVSHSDVLAWSLFWFWSRFRWRRAFCRLMWFALPVRMFDSSFRTIRVASHSRLRHLPLDLQVWSCPLYHWLSCCYFQFCNTSINDPLLIGVISMCHNNSIISIHGVLGLSHVFGCNT